MKIIELTLPSGLPVMVNLGGILYFLSLTSDINNPGTSIFLKNGSAINVQTSYAALSRFIKEIQEG